MASLIVRNLDEELVRRLKMRAAEHGRSASYLVDTNVVSELRRRPRASAAVRAWFASVDDGALFLSVRVIGELRKGVERIRRRDAAAAQALGTRLDRVVAGYSERVLPVTAEIADVWGWLNARDPLPVIESLLAATAQVHGMTVVTRNVADIARTGVAVVDPFADDL